MNKAQRKRIIRHAENIIAALPGGDSEPEVKIALGAIQVLLDHTVGLATTMHLARRLNALATEAITLDLERAGEKG